MTERQYFEQFAGDISDEARYYAVSGTDRQIASGPFKTREEAVEDMAGWRAWELAGAMVAEVKGGNMILWSR